MRRQCMPGPFGNRIAARKLHDGDGSQHELLDVLSNRLIGLF